MTDSGFAFDLQPSLIDEARKVAESEGVALDQFINAAIAEKLSSLQTDRYFRERASRANMSRALDLLSRAGKGNPPDPGDEILK